MCTVTLRCGGGSLLLTMNRDERFERAPEEPPKRIAGDPGRPVWIAPFDGATGGTWIGVNERGVAACVVNGYAPEDAPLAGRPGVPSRGSIIPRILEEQDGFGPARVIGAVDFSAYPSFSLLVASCEGGEILTWRHGGAIQRSPFGTGWTLLTSSSWNAPEVSAWRRRAFEKWRREGEAMQAGIPALHLLAPPGEEDRAPFMTRERAATRSIGQIRVSAGGAAELRWWPRIGVGAIDPAVPAAVLDLPIVAPAGPPNGSRG
jgi:Transport and Golgi organisation 2